MPFQTSMPPLDQVRDRLVASAARVWRRARDRSRPVQTDLARLLTTMGLAVLAPVLDGLCRAFENAVGRRLRPALGRSRSADERLLCRLLAGEQPQHCLNCSAASTDLLHCALCSTRIMLALALPSAGARP